MKEWHLGPDRWNPLSTVLQAASVQRMQLLERCIHQSDLVSIYFEISFKPLLFKKITLKVSLLQILLDPRDFSIHFDFNPTTQICKSILTLCKKSVRFGLVFHLLHSLQMFFLHLSKLHRFDDVRNLIKVESSVIQRSIVD